MNDVGLACAGGAAVLFGLYTFLVKRYVAHYPATVYVALTYAASLVWYVPIASVTTDGPLLPDEAGLNGLGVLAFVVLGSVVAILSLFRAISEGEVSYVAPISKLVPVFVVPVEVALLGQHLTPLQLVGIVVATVAVYVANYRSGSLLEPLRSAASYRPAQFALLSAAAFGVTDVGKRALTQELGMAPELVNLALFVGVPLAMLPLAARRTSARVLGDAHLFVGLGLLLAIGEHLVMLAFSLLPASLASPVINSSAVVTVVLGGVLLNESSLRLRIAAATLAVAGVTLIGMG